MLGRKQTEDNHNFVRTYKNIEQIISKREAQELVDKTAKAINDFFVSKKIVNPAYGWSGGKDSQALSVVMKKVGVRHSCLCMETLFEFDANREWLIANKPEGCKIMRTGHSWEWLKGHDDKIFPASSAESMWWFTRYIHRGQDRYYRTNSLDVLVYGRRIIDGNYTGKNGYYKTKDGLARYSPIREWSHEQVMAVTHYFTSGLAPSYDWKDGFVRGVGPWVKWRAETQEEGYEAVYEVDASAVLKAGAEGVPSAKKWLESRSLFEKD